MKIMVITETLHAGGAETFVVRLAGALAINHDVTLINIYPHYSKNELIEQVSKKVTLINLRYPFRFILSKIDALLYRCKIDFSWIEILMKRKLKEHIQEFEPSAVHTHLFKTDYYVSSVKIEIKLKFNHVTTNHGDYLMYESQQPVRLLNYNKKLHQTLKSISTMVVISNDQFKWAVEKKARHNYTFNISKILNGFSFHPPFANGKSEIRLNDSDFIYGMVGRGIKEKGWYNVINAFNRLEIKNKKLLLVGEGPALDDLKSTYKDDDKIIFIGYAPKPMEYIKFFHVALFASFYSGESLPTVVIEYLACNKPVIATNIGEVKEMLQTASRESAGLLINFDREGVDDESLFEKMQALHADTALRNKLARLTSQAFLKFDMQHCVDSYLNVYGEMTK